PMHDWTQVKAGISHSFHHAWIQAISDVLNERILPQDYYALPEQAAAGFVADVLTLQRRTSDETLLDEGPGGTATALRTRPQTRFSAEAEFFRRIKSNIAV